MKLTTFQKINLLLISYLIVCFISEIIVISIDINNYQQIGEIEAQKEFIWQSIEWASIFIMGLFLIIIPNAFSIVVHDLKSSLVPPIGRLSILLKNLPIYLLIFITLTALVTLAFLKDNEVATFLANKIAGNRINSHDKANLGINVLYFSLFLLFVLPMISFYNWMHYIGVVIYRKIIERIKQKNDTINSLNSEQ
jgi:hypothetical protein